MKRNLYALVMLLCGGMMFAQSNQPTQTNVGSPTDTNEPVYTGCVSGTHNNYFLIADDGRQYRLHSDKDIPEHVGRRVEIRGTRKKEGIDKPADAAKTGADQEIDVADLKNVAQSCYGTPGTGANSASAAQNQGTMVASASQPCTPNSSAGISGSNTGAVSTTGSQTVASGSTTGVNTNSTASMPANDNASALPQSDQPVTDVKGDQPLFKGCVTGTHNKYTLNATNGDRFRLHSDKDIKEHLGDFVEIRGTLKPEGESKAKAGGPWKGELDVNDIKTVSKGCDTNQQPQQPQ